uniref:Uncharacterized protein n=1 Tax=Romanomermis culicivorax TaxID=13658 RepID=A0A915JVG9_ROMCU
MHADFQSEIQSLEAVPLASQNNLIGDIKHHSGIQNIDEEPNLHHFKIYLSEFFDTIKPSKLEQESADVASISRYIFGALLSSVRDVGTNVYEMRPKEENVPSETTFLIRLNVKDSINELLHQERNLILNVNEHLNTKDVFDDRSELTENANTLLVHFAQNLEKSSFDPMSGYLERSVNIHQAQFSTFKEKYTLQRIKKGMGKNGDDKSRTVNYLENMDDDTISDQSVSFGGSFRESDSNMHYKSEPNDHSLPLEGVAQMIKLTTESNKQNDIANFYFVDDFQFANNRERRFAKKSDYLEACNGNRLKRIMLDICGKTNDNQETEQLEPEVVHVTLEKKVILEELSAISNHAMMGFMVRDLILDIYHENKPAIFKDSSFLLATIFSPQIAHFLSKKASVMLANEFKMTGYLTKGLAFGVSRAVSLYVLYDFIDNTIQYIGNNSDQSAKTAMEIDGAFLAIDTIVGVINGLEFLGVITGAFAIAGPISGIIAVGLVLALNLYDLHNRIKNIGKIVHLSFNDRMEERLRGFFHMDPAQNVEELMNEAIANEQLKTHAMNFLTKQHTYDTFFTKSATIVNGTLRMESDATINVQNEEQFFVSRASPKSTENFTTICKLGEESIELRKWKFWLDGVVNFFKPSSQDDHILHWGYVCRHSFGVKVSSNSQTLAAYFDMGDGDDVVKGFVNASNSFRLGKGRKLISGGDRDDIFTLDNLNITGMLHGGSGMDTLHISSREWSPNILLFDNRFLSNEFEVRDVEIILGRPGVPDNILYLCTFRMVRLYGGDQSNADHIKIPDNDCIHDMVIYLDGQTGVHNSANTGHFVYAIIVTLQ